MHRLRWLKYFLRTTFQMPCRRFSVFNLQNPQKQTHTRVGNINKLWRGNTLRYFHVIMPKCRSKNISSLIFVTSAVRIESLEILRHWINNFSFQFLLGIFHPRRLSQCTQSSHVPFAFLFFWSNSSSHVTAQPVFRCH